ncbi:hypothetical protein [Reinekea sp. G2M2-21]|uniref:hypothetical protein n=1 Tax=Reinekea sp. G2M2-21 TaxID=2788942 RepID=UPI0018AAAAF3|nr:hypothetical protein [Reinekea sp. G2M2-21]
MIFNGIRFSDSTEMSLVALLSNLATSDRRVRLFLGNPATGEQDYCEAGMMEGQVDGYFSRLCLIDGDTVNRFDDSRVVQVVSSDSNRILWKATLYTPVNIKDLTLVDSESPVRNWDGLYLPFEVYRGQTRINCFSTRTDALVFMQNFTDCREREDNEVAA